jgi:hypothetical protein
MSRLLLRATAAIAAAFAAVAERHETAAEMLHGLVDEELHAAARQGPDRIAPGFERTRRWSARSHAGALVTALSRARSRSGHQ